MLTKFYIKTLIQEYIYSFVPISGTGYRLVQHVVISLCGNVLNRRSNTYA